MDQTFHYRAAPVPLHRRASRRVVTATVVACVVATAVVAMSRWVIDSERRSLARADDAVTTSAAVGTIAGSEPAAVDPTTSVLDAAARADARTALDAARDAARGKRSFVDAGPGELGMAGGSALAFVDGPSQAPGVVSVASTRSSWGAAVMGASGTCYLLRFSPGEGVAYGTGVECTGHEALAATGSSW